MREPVLKNARKNNLKKAIIVGISLFVSGLHFITGSQYGGPFPGFVNGYLIDILLPFTLYFLISLFAVPLLQPWWVRALLPFLIGSAVELAQYGGIPIFGQTFDALDFLAYAAGSLLAAFFDHVLMPAAFPFWDK